MYRNTSGKDSFPIIKRRSDMMSANSFFMALSQSVTTRPLTSATKAEKPGRVFRMVEAYSSHSELALPNMVCTCSTGNMPT